MGQWYFFAVILLNVAISVWNCYAVGIAWKDTVAFGSRRMKVVLYAAICQSSIGFSLPIMLVLGSGAMWWLQIPRVDDAGNLTPPLLTRDEAEAFWRTLYDFWYVVMVLPFLSSGYIITGYTLREAYRRRDFDSISVGGWNSHASIRSTARAVDRLGGKLGNIAELFKSLMSGADGATDTMRSRSSGRAGKGKAIALLIAVVIVSILIGTVFAFSLVRYFANRTESRLEEYGKTLEAERNA